MPRQLSGGWLKNYLDYTNEDEAPENYKYWSGISALSTSLKRNVYAHRGKTRVFANQYIILVGPPATGKGVAMRPALEIVKEANVAHYIEDRATAERIQEVLADGFIANKGSATTGIIMGQDHCATAVAEELSVLLGASDWMLQFFCSLWDKNEFTYNTKKEKDKVIKDNCFGILAGCVPDYIRKINKDSAGSVTTGGFTSRAIFVFAGKKGKTIAWPADKDLNMKDALINDLRYIAQLKGEVSWTKEAKDLFTDFYVKNDSGGSEYESDVLLNFRGRMWSHVFKNSIILSVSEKDDLIIEERHVKKSIEIIHEILRSLDITFRGVGESSLADATSRVMDFIETKGSCTYPEILRANQRHITAEDLTRVLFTLVTINFCFEGTTGKSFRYTFNKQFNATQTIGAIKNAAASGTP